MIANMRNYTECIAGISAFRVACDAVDEDKVHYEKPKAVT